MIRKKDLALVLDIETKSDRIFDSRRVVMACPVGGPSYLSIYRLPCFLTRITRRGPMLTREIHTDLLL